MRTRAPFSIFSTGRLSFCIWLGCISVYLSMIILECCEETTRFFLFAALSDDLGRHMVTNYQNLGEGGTYNFIHLLNDIYG